LGSAMRPALGCRRKSSVMAGLSRVYTRGLSSFNADAGFQFNMSRNSGVVKDGRRRRVYRRRRGGGGGASGARCQIVPLSN
jgi:hypothetical protein